MSAAAERGPIRSDDRPGLAAGVRMQPDRLTGQDVLLFPEGILVLNPTGAAIIALCDGRRTVAQVVTELADRHEAPPETISADVFEYLARLDARGLMTWAEQGEAAS